MTPFVKIWLWVCALASLGGWALSAVGELNRTGYLLLSAAVCAALIVKRRSLGEQLGTVSWKKVRNRFRRGLPFFFLVLAALVFLGGVLYAPTNHTALTYRTPRVLQWLSHEHWFWIHSPNYRMNNRACGFEWLTAPLLLFTRSDRALFLINFVPFLLLPGLTFSLFTRLGVRPRVAWQWMWLMPTGYNFLLQAGSIGNDTFPAVYALAALDFGCRAWHSKRDSDLWHSLVAAALLTGAKASNLPLLLPWALLLLALGRLLLQRPLRTALVIILAAGISFLPTAVLNRWYCGDWSGLVLERSGMEMKNPLVGLWGNSFLFILHNFVPPFFPQAGWWNQSALTRLPHWFVSPLVANFEKDFHRLWEIPSEDWVGLGFGLSMLALISVVYRWVARAAKDGTADRSVPLRESLPARWAWILRLAPWVALAVYSMKSGMVTGARIISPYYPLLLPLLLAGPQVAQLVRQRWWAWLVGANLIIALPVLLLTPPRPLWPAQTILEKLQNRYSGNRLLDRAVKVYAVYGERADPLTKVRALVPEGLRQVGFLADGDDIDISLWRPFGKRRVEHLLLTDSREQLRQKGLTYVVVGSAYLAANGISLDDWMKWIGAELVATTTVTMKLSEGAKEWYVVRLRE